VQPASIHAAKQSNAYFASVMFSGRLMSAWDPTRTSDTWHAKGGACYSDTILPEASVLTAARAGPIPLGCNPGVSRLEPIGTLKGPLFGRERVAINQPLVTHRLPVPTADLKGLTPGLHVVLQCISDLPRSASRKPGAAPRLLSKLQRVGAPLVRLLPIQDGPLLSGQSLLRGEIPTELPSLICDIAGKVSGSDPAAHLARGRDWRAGAVTAPGATAPTLGECDARRNESHASEG